MTNKKKTDELRAVPKKRRLFDVSEGSKRPKYSEPDTRRQKRTASINNLKRPAGLRAYPKKTQFFQVNHQIQQPTYTASNKTADARQLKPATPSWLKSKTDMSLDQKMSPNNDHVDENIREQGHDIGELVWASLGCSPWWPAIIVPGSKAGFSPAENGSSWVLWFGQHKLSKVKHKKIVPFMPNYVKYSSSIKAGKVFVKGLEEILLECAVRLNNSSVLEKRTTKGSLFCELDRWASGGFQVNYSEAEQDQVTSQENRLPDWVNKKLDKLYHINKKSTDDESSDNEEKCSSRKETIKPGRRLDLVKRNQLNIEEVCLACMSSDVVIQHPYFKGGLCKFCKEAVMETMFLHGDDGYNIYCIICGNGGRLFICDAPGCRKVYCTVCITALVGLKHIKLIKDMPKWKCFFCSDPRKQSHGLLEKKSDWRQNIIHMFPIDGDSEMCLQVNIPHNMPKRPMRVLSLFDGMASGKVVLDLLDIEIEAYYASEIDKDAIAVADLCHGSSIQQVGDIRELSGSKLTKMCPIDLVIGGSPCDQFSIVNRCRKGLVGSSGLLFLEFVHVLNKVQMLTRDRPVFWLYENVASMTSDVKRQLSHHLRCNPAKWDAVHFSPQRRRRFFWGNIPGLYCLQSVNSVCTPPDLGECLMGSRKAKVKKICTVTTQKNSLMQFKGVEGLPVQMGSTDDILWVPEIERVFGFPTHYTDVANLSTTRRRKLLGKAWSVPVVKHLLAPLCQFYKLRK